MEKFQNLRELIPNMKKENRFIQVFIFLYKKEEYIGVIKRFLQKDNKKPYEFSLNFFKGERLEYSIECIITYKSLFISNLQEFKEFFNVDSSNGWNFRAIFDSLLGEAIPTKISMPVNKKHERAAIITLNISDNQEVDKIYCYDTIIHSNKKRSEYNGEKTSILEPNLYKILKDDKKVSFCYSSDENDKKTTKDIVKRYHEKLKEKSR